MTEEQFRALSIDPFFGWTPNNLPLWLPSFFIYGTQILCRADYTITYSWLVMDCDSPEEAVATLMLIKVLQ